MGGLVPTADASTSSFAGSLWAPKKEVKILLFNATDSKYTYIHRKEQRHPQKACINGQKKRKWGGRVRQGVGWSIQEYYTL